MEFAKTVNDVYGNKIRVRVSGLCWRNDAILLVRHKGLKSGSFWAPPGGGVEFEESLEQCLKREFFEETGLTVSVGRFRFGCEFIRAPLHAIELFFEVTEVEGQLLSGQDPELPILDEARFIGTAELDAMDRVDLHGIFGFASRPQEFDELGGFYRI